MTKPFCFLQGFEPRDTDIGRKLVVWKNVESHTGYQKTFSLSPYAEKKRYLSLVWGRLKKMLSVKLQIQCSKITYVNCNIYAVLKSDQEPCQ